MNIPLTTLLVLTPIVSGFIGAYLFPTNKDVGRENPLRPPSWVFRVIWPILYILIGISWVLLRRKKEEAGEVVWIIDVVFITLVVLLFLWLYTANKLNNYRYAYYIIVAIASLASIITIISYHTHEPYVFLWIPFLVWITIASNLNYSIAYIAD